eukprot:m.211239 g.211239  ORF g.211239 m.211239 type:complete len:504 (-) comp33104_c4_seq14:15-1526(-)
MPHRTNVAVATTRMRTVLLLMMIAGVDLAIAQPKAPQTRTQSRLIHTHLPDAIVADQNAGQRVIGMLGDEHTVEYLKLLDDGSGLHKLPATELNRLFWQEVSAGELVHSFGDSLASGLANCGFDLTVAMGLTAPEFYNQWQLQAKGLVPVDGANNMFTEWCETELFGFPPFANVSAPDLKTATDRPYYAALNMYRGSGGNPQCGPVSAVLSRRYVAEQILAAPVDTGFFQGACGNGQTTGKLGPVTLPVCNAWPNGSRTLGVPPYLNHLLEPFVHYYNESEADVGPTFWNLKLARLLTRFISRKTYADSSQQSQALPLNFVENTLGYFELNPLESIIFPTGIKMMIGMYELLFGTPRGDVLRQWCIKMGWPLVWAFNPLMSFFRCGPAGNAPECKFPQNLTVGNNTAAVRILDPMVLQNVETGSNVTVTPDLLANFEHLWNSTNINNVPQSELSPNWNKLEAVAFATLAVEPLFFDACEHEDCIGVLVNSQTCVCPNAATRAE